MQRVPSRNRFAYGVFHFSRKASVLPFALSLPYPLHPTGWRDRREMRVGLHGQITSDFGGFSFFALYFV